LKFHQPDLLTVFAASEQFLEDLTPLFQLVVSRRIGINDLVSQESLKCQKVVVAGEIAHTGIILANRCHG
jgi:hypothetical protein